jgi:hypothetical protein
MPVFDRLTQHVKGLYGHGRPLKLIQHLVIRQRGEERSRRQIRRFRIFLKSSVSVLMP